jgi:hypothetical protein
MMGGKIRFTPFGFMGWKGVSVNTYLSQSHLKDYILIMIGLSNISSNKLSNTPVLEE